MPTLMRLVHVLRKGPRRRRVQAWAGLLLLAGAGLWLIWEYLLPILGAILVAAFGAWLIRRSLREPRSSS